MSIATTSARRRQGRGAPPTTAWSRESASLDEAWMRLACQGTWAQASALAASPVARQVREPRTGHRDSAARRKRHPAVVSRLRAAQRFSGPERRDVPHA